MGRPRKYPKVVVENGEGEQKSSEDGSATNEPKVKKKRGRKPKIRTPEELALLSQVGKKKRGRKPKEKFNFNANNTNSDNNINETESIIVRLSISPDEIKNLDINNKQPKPFDPNENIQYNSNNLGFSNINKNRNSNIKLNENSDENNDDNDIKINDETNNKSNNDNKLNINIIPSDNNLLNKKEDSDEINNRKTLINQKHQNLLNISKNNISQKLKSDSNMNIFNENFIKTNSYNEKLDNRQISLLLKNKFNKENKIDVLIQLAHCNKMEQWPVKTNICCMWCCHEFDNTPWGIPYKYEDEKFHLFGIFCSPNCAASHIFNNISFKTTKWECFALLNLLYYKIYNKMNEISLAPSKLCLKKFGGCMEIDEFRDKLNNNNIYLLKFPPAISIIPVIEEINENKYNINNMNKTNNFIPLDTNRIKKANKELKLKRSKPLTNSKNTLDSCMNINIIST